MLQSKIYPATFHTAGRQEAGADRHFRVRPATLTWHIGQVLLHTRKGTDGKCSILLNLYEDANTPPGQWVGVKVTSHAPQLM